MDRIFPDHRDVQRLILSEYLSRIDRFFLFRSLGIIKPLTDNVWIINNAAKKGYISVLKWLQENGCCLWDTYTCAYAASNGHLEVLKWLRKNGCP